MSEVSDDDIERLAARLAMMVSEEGEAANAGRAVAQLARRLGLTGGALKEMFLHGAIARPTPTPAGDAAKLERELGTVRKSLRVLEASYRALEYERDAMARELEAVRARAEAARNRSQVGFILLGVLSLAIAGAGAVGWLMAIGDLDRPSAAAPLAAAVPAAPAPVIITPANDLDFGPVVRRVGVIRASRAVARRQPDEASPAMATLQQGMPVVVRRIFGNLRPQWAEVEVGSSIGYVVLTEIDLS